jgi:hypothetical protein
MVSPLGLRIFNSGSDSVTTGKTRGPCGLFFEKPEYLPHSSFGDTSFSAVPDYNQEHGLMLLEKDLCPFLRGAL